MNDVEKISIQEKVCISDYDRYGEFRQSSRGSTPYGLALCGWPPEGMLPCLGQKEGYSLVRASNLHLQPSISLLMVIEC